MRKIRFRVWDNVHKEWLKYKEWPVGWQCPMDKPAKLIKMHVYVTKDNKVFNELQYCIDSPNFDVVEFTGKKDKDGKEIYEGDIVEMEAVYDYPGEYGGSINRTYTGEVVIIPSKGVCLKKPRVIERNEDNEEWTCQYYINVASYRSKFIGNIYENQPLTSPEIAKQGAMGVDNLFP